MLRLGVVLMLGSFLSGGAGGSSSGTTSVFVSEILAVAFGSTRLYMGRNSASYTETDVYPQIIKGLITSSNITVKKVWVRASVAPGDSCVVTLRKFDNADTSINFTFDATDTYKEWTGSTSISAVTGSSNDSFVLAFNLASGVWGATFSWGIVY